jgi:hypothetical protein
MWKTRQLKVEGVKIEFLQVQILTKSLYAICYTQFFHWLTNHILEVYNHCSNRLKVVRELIRLKFKRLTPKVLRSGFPDQNSQVKGVRPDELWRDPILGAEGANNCRLATINLSGKRTEEKGLISYVLTSPARKHIALFLGSLKRS